MFEISWSELLILGVVTLIFVGPKELPVFFRTLGRYAGSLRKQAQEFRTHFDAAMREAELDSMKSEFEAMQTSVNAEVMRAGASLDASASAAPAPRIAPAVGSNLAAPPMPATPRGAP